MELFAAGFIKIAQYGLIKMLKKILAIFKKTKKPIIKGRCLDCKFLIRDFDITCNLPFFSCWISKENKFQFEADGITQEQFRQGMFDQAYGCIKFRPKNANTNNK